MCIFQVKHDRTLSCDKCDFLAESQTDLDRHSKIHGITYKCNHCDFKTKVKSESLSHNLEIHSQVQLIKCDLCDYSCVFQSSLNFHWREKHPNVPKKVKKVDNSSQKPEIKPTVIKILKPELRKVCSAKKTETEPKPKKRKVSRAKKTKTEMKNTVYQSESRTIIVQPETEYTGQPETENTGQPETENTGQPEMEGNSTFINQEPETFIKPEIDDTDPLACVKTELDPDENSDHLDRGGSGDFSNGIVIKEELE